MRQPDCIDTDDLFTTVIGPALDDTLAAKGGFAYCPCCKKAFHHGDRPRLIFRPMAGVKLLCLAAHDECDRYVGRLLAEGQGDVAFMVIDAHLNARERPYPGWVITADDTDELLLVMERLFTRVEERYPPGLCRRVGL